MASTTSSYNKTLLAIQKLANNSAKSIQQMVNNSNAAQMDFNRTEAETARNWEKMMSDTAHQREVADLKNSGLNPVLSVNNGAQSYTTSSASTSNDSGASATSAILEGQIGVVTNLESARMSTEAQLKASRQQAAAVRYAAQQSAAAQRYAAQQQAAASVYHSNVQNEINKRTTNANKYIATHKQPSSLFGFIDKQLEQTGGNSIIKMLARPLKKKFERAFKDPGQLFANNGKITQNNFKLSKNGQNMFDALNKRAGLKPNVANRRLAVKAFFFQDASALRLYNSRVQTARRARPVPHHGYVNAPRRGHR